MISLIFRLFGDASPLKRTLAGVRTDAKSAGTAAGHSFNQGLAQGGSLRSLVGSARGFAGGTLSAGGLGGLGGLARAGGVAATLGAGAAAVAGGASTAAEEALRIQNLSDQLGLTTMDIQKAELAEKLYGAQVRESAKALKEGMSKIKDSEVVTADLIKSMADAQRQRLRSVAELDTAMSPVYDAVNDVTGAIANLGAGFLRLDRRLGTMIWGGKAPSGASGSWGDDAALENYLGAKGKTVPSAEERASIKPPTADAMQRIGLFVGGAPVSSQTLKVHQAQLAVLTQINTGVRQLNAQLR